MEDTNMKHTTEVHPNKSLITIHINEIITPGYIDHFEAGKTPLGMALENIPGVTEVSFSKYEICLKKGDMFNWSQILPAAIRIIYQSFSSVPDNVTYQLPADVNVFAVKTNYLKKYVTGTFIDDIEINIPAEMYNY
jgi:hypothetical protein